MSAAPVKSGVLRARPRYGTGHWSARYYVLTLSDSTLRAYSSDAVLSAPADSAAATPAHTYLLTDDMVVSDPFEKHVRTSQRTPKKETVWGLQITRSEGDKQIVFTVGAATRAEAAAWKLALESVIKKASPPVKQRDPSRRKLTHKESLWGQDDKWQVVEVQDGIQIEGETEFTKDFPSLRARCTVKGDTETVFQLIMDDSKRSLWDDGVQHSEVLKEVSDTCAIVYMQMRGIWLGPLFTGARDLVLLRYYRKDDDGTITITWQSVEDPALSPPREGFVRGRVFAMSFTITPQGNDASKVYLTCHADPGGLLTNSPSVVLQRWLLPFVTRITGIKKALGESSMENVPGVSGKDLPTPDDEQPAAARASVKSTTPPAPLAKSSSGKDLGEPNPLHIGSMNASEWMQTPSSEPFTIRGKTYLSDGIKYKTGQHMFHLAAVELYKLEAPSPHCCARSDSPLVAIKREFPGRQVFCMQFLLPGPPFYALAFYAVAKKGVMEEETPFTRLWNDFCEGDDEKKNSLFKMIPRVTQGSYVVKKTVGEVPALLGHKMKMVYYHGPDYLEADCDLGTSAVAGSILSIVKGYATTLTLDLGILLEGHSEDELPEVMLVSLRLVKPVMAKCKALPADPNPAQTQKNRELVESKGESREELGKEREDE